MEKNLNKVRQFRPVFKRIKFNNVQQAARFINLYKDLFYSSNDDKRYRNGTGFYTYEENESIVVHCAINKKSNWELIKETLNLKLIEKGRYGHDIYKYEEN